MFIDNFQINKKIIPLITIVFSFILLFMVFNQHVIAQNTNPVKDACEQISTSASDNNPEDSAVCKDSNSTDNPLTGSNGLVLKISYIIATIAGVIAVIMIIVAGAKMIVSSGDANAVKLAKTQLMHAVIGLAIVALAQTIVVFSINMFLE